MILSTAKPDLFRGGLFVGGAVFWDDKVPSDARSNSAAIAIVFVIGLQRPGRQDTVRRTALAYQEAGV